MILGRRCAQCGPFGPRLWKVPVAAGTYLLKPGWRRADVALLAELPALRRHGIRQPAVIRTAIGWLTEHEAALGRLPRQLVHGDIGPDNVLLDGAQVVAIIDFTPHVLPVLCAASTALYCYHVYGQPAISATDLAASRAAMGEVRPWAAGEHELWTAGLAWEGLRGLATTLELARRGRAEPGPAAWARMAAVEAITTRAPGPAERL